MVSVVTLVGLVALQQLQGSPFPGEVGAPMTVEAKRDGRPIVGVVVAVELPGGAQREVGMTGADGRVAFVPEAAGGHVFTARIDGVDVLAPHPVVAQRRRWLLALASVPVGAALLWRLSRGRGRCDP